MGDLLENAKGKWGRGIGLDCRAGRGVGGDFGMGELEKV